LDTSILTAIGNDYGYERSFSRQVEALGVAGDVLFGLTTSGRSPNILAAMRAVRDQGLVTVSFTGNGPGAADLGALSDALIRVPSASTPVIQEGHEVIGHAICGVIRGGDVSPPLILVQRKRQSATFSKHRMPVWR